MRRKFDKRDLGWFLLGLGSQTQIVASLSFTELFVYLAAPFLFSREWPLIRRNGLGTFFALSVFLVLGCVVSCVMNHSPALSVLRGMAVVMLFPCSIIVMHWMLRKDMAGFKWYLVGTVLSLFMCTFLFRQANEAILAERIGGDSVEAIMSGPLYWIRRLSAAVILPSRGWYLQCPFLYTIVAPVFMAIFSMVTSVSGRSAALCSFAMAAMVILGGKKRATIRNRVCRNFWIVMIVGICGVFFAKFAYSYAATHNWLGLEQQKKYEAQTSQGDSIVKLLLAGRGASFGGLLACVDKPIVGFGPWAEDRWGYGARFLLEYGSPEDWAAQIRVERMVSECGGRVMFMAHSYITNFWLWFGLPGLIIWIYVSFVFIRYLKQDCWAVPQWFCWLAAGIPGYFWAMCFSAYGGDRVGNVLFIVACLLVRAVRKGRFQLPYDMEREMLKYEGFAPIRGLS